MKSYFKLLNGSITPMCKEKNTLTKVGVKKFGKITILLSETYSLTAKRSPYNWQRRCSVERRTRGH